MARMPVLTSGRLLVARGEIDPPYEDDGSDWAVAIALDVTDEDASLLGSYWNSGYGAFLGDGNADHLAAFVGVQVNGLPLVTDPGLIEEFDDGYGYVDVREIYEQGL